jgi:hypothetical protein
MSCVVGGYSMDVLLLGFIHFDHVAPRNSSAAMNSRAGRGLSGDDSRAGAADACADRGRSCLRRARRRPSGVPSRALLPIDERVPEQSQQATLRALGDEQARELVASYIFVPEVVDVLTLRASGSRG